MTFWNNIVNTALLGTEKKQVSGVDLSEDLSVLWEKINGSTQTDNEEKFLQIAALGFNYRKCGTVPLKKDNLVAGLAAEEELPYCNREALSVLNEILAEENNSLLRLWLKECNSKNKVVPAELAPVLLDKAVKNKAIRPLVVICCGKRGEWLGGLNKNWDFKITASLENEWQSGSAEQRRKVLRTIRETDPAKAREMLIQTWGEENANSRADLLEQMEPNIGDEDKDWLESLLAEKSQKVKDEALRLLKLMPSSAILQQYWEIIKKAVTLKKEKGFLGFTSKMVLQVQAPVVEDDAVFKSGIDKLSKGKKITDDDYILQQLIQGVPPDWWELHLNNTPENIIGYFQKDENTRKFLDSMMQAAIKFKNKKWVLVLLGVCTSFYIESIPLLPEKEQEALLIRNFPTNDQARSYVSDMEKEWPLALSKVILTYAAANPYSYNQGFFRDNIHLIPINILPDLPSFTPAVTTADNKNNYAVHLWGKIANT